jgi:hypothetical protein
LEKLLPKKNLELAKKCGLDPFARQIWATPAGIFVGQA